jgi:RIO kinase 2
VYVQALGDHGFPVPTAIDNNRHAVLMELVDAQPLVQVGAGNGVVLHSVLLRLLSGTGIDGWLGGDFDRLHT